MYWLAAAAAVMAPDPSSAEAVDMAVPAKTVRVSAAGLFALADKAEQAGDRALAESAYRALLDDPDGAIRTEARFRHAKLLARAGRSSAARAMLRRLLDERPDAAAARLEYAHLLDTMGDKDGAWRQIRAVQAGELPPQVARLVDRYSEALRSARPFGASLEVAIAPDSNINRSTRLDSLGTVLGDFAIDEDSKARSGTGLALRAQAYRRLALGDQGSSFLVRLGGLADLYGRSRFNDVSVQLSGGPEFELGRNRVQLELGASQRWLGQKPVLRAARMAAHWSRPVGHRTQVRASASGALIDNRINDLQDGRSLSLQLGAEHALSPVTGIAVHAAGDRLSAEDPGYSTTGWRAGVTAWRDIGRSTVTAGVEFGRLEADERLLLFPEKRSDRSLRLSLGASFRNLAVGGVAPVLRLVNERNDSNIAFHDYRRTRTEFGIVRAF